LFFLTGLSFGLAFGLLMFVISIFSNNVFFNVGSTVYRGMTAGIFGLAFSPLWGIVLAWFALVMFLPFKLFMRVFERLEFTAFINEQEEDVGPQSTVVQEETTKPQSPDERKSELGGER